MKGLSLRKKLGLVLLSAFLLVVSLYSSSPNVKTANALTTGDGLIFENGSIIGYEGTDTDVSIPATINGESVISIDGAFNYNDYITSVNIAEGITAIENGAFYGCSQLASIQIPASVTSISGGSLAAGENLATIALAPANTSFTLVDSILYNADQTEIIQHIPTSDSGIYYIPETVVTVHDFAFAYSTEITHMAIPIGVSSIGIGAFSSCPKLVRVIADYEGNNPYFSYSNDMLFSEDGKTLLAYPANKIGANFTIPAEVETLMPYAFTGCLNLNTITFSASVTQADGAFINSSSLLNINVAVGNTTYSSVAGTLADGDGTTLLYYPTGRTASSYTTPAGITKIGELAFFMHPHIQTVILTDGVTYIESYAFYECDGITKLVVPESVLYFAPPALHGAQNIEVWGYPLSEAEYYAYTWDIPFVAMGLSSDWTYVNNDDGTTCSITGYLGTETDVFVPSVVDNLWVDTVEPDTFVGYSDIEYITFYESVKTIEIIENIGSSYIFEDCTSLREIYLPASLETFEKNNADYKPFKGCTSLINIIVDNNSNSFYDTDGVLFLKNKNLVAYPSGRTSQSYVIPGDTTGISYTAFENNYLNTVTVPGSVSILSKGTEPTFKNNISKVYLSEGITDVGDVFSQTVPIDIYFPVSVTTVTGFDYGSVPHTFYVYENSAPHDFAKTNGINYVVLCVITFNSNGGTNANTQVVPNGLKVSEPENVTKKDHVLLGWYTDVALTNQWSFADTVSSSMTLYAKWVGGYPIIYHMNGGVNDLNNPTYYIKGATVFLENPTKTDYTFDGWYTNESCALQYKFEAIESTTTGSVELWADWWVLNPTYDNTTSGGTIDSDALSDERRPEISQSDFPTAISYMQEGQKITVTGKIHILYANVEEISVMYSDQIDKLYKYQTDQNRLDVFDYSHSFEVGEISHSSADKYVITIRLSTGEFYQYDILINKYSLVTEVLGAPYSTLYMSSDKKYELRSMAVAPNSFDMQSASHQSLNPEICSVVNGSTLVPLAAGTSIVKTTITLSGGSVIIYENEFKVIEKTINEPSTIERELMCPCYGRLCTGFPEGGIDPVLLDLIEQIREEAGVPVYIVGGYLCPEYNKSLGGDEESEHVQGSAADIWAKDLHLDELYDICDMLNETGGVGKYATYIHIDTRDAYIRWDED